MVGPYRDLIKHSAIYGIGHVLSRSASFLLLPVYTSYLRPADYGVIAILDPFAGILAILIGAGIASAVTRYHFEAKDETERNQVWWTGLTFVVFTGAVFLLPAMLSRNALANWTLGPAVMEGAFYYALILPTMWLNVPGHLLNEYLIVRKWSGVTVGVSFFRLALNIGLNVYFLVVLELGITGILVGNLITSAAVTLILAVIFSKSVQSYSFHYPLLRKLWKFGGPLIITALLSFTMDQADRYLLRIFLTMDQVGIYSLAYTVSQGMYTLFLLPFSMIYTVLMYEIADWPDAKQIYVRVFEYFTYGLGLLLLGVSLFSKKLLGLMVAQDYFPAAEIIPIVCLGFLLFSLHLHFTVPVLLAKKTIKILPVVSVAALTNIGANLFLIPFFGTAGAAWATVITFGVYSFVGLWRYRRIDRFDYPFGKCAMVLVGMVVSYVGYDWLVHWQGDSVGIMALAIGIWFAWFIVLFGAFLRNLGTEYTWVGWKSLFPFKSAH